MTVIKDISALVKRLCAHSRETEWFEFKSSDAKPDKIGRNISAIAIANATAIAGRSNGYVIWGIHDIDYRVIGTSFNPDSKRVRNDDLDHWLAQRLKPSIDFRFYKATVDGKDVVVLLISRALHQPVRFDNEAYIRVGSHTRKLNDFPERERQLWHLSDRRTFEKGTAIERVQRSDVLRLLDYKSYFNLSNTPTPPHTSTLLQTLQNENFVRQRDDGA